jgi:YjbE family integral membrane protein
LELISLAELSALLQVILVDLVLAGDNAIVIAMAVTGLPPEQRGRVLAIGIAAATVLRIVFASVTVQLLQIIGLVFAGGVLLLWVSWKLWRELRQHAKEDAAAEGISGFVHGDPGQPVTEPEKTFRAAVVQIIVADVSMSLDNVLAVAGVARDHGWVLIFGLALSVAFMGLAAAIIAKVLARHHWVAYVGLAVILYVALKMIWEGTLEMLEAAA